MVDILQFIQQNYLECISLGLSILFLLIPNSYKFIKFILGGVLKMIKKYKTEQTVEKTVGQSFETQKPVYRVNKSTGELVKTEDTVNIKELVKSNLETCLTVALARLMPDSMLIEKVKNQSIMQEDLDFLQEASNLAEDIKEQFGLDNSLSIKEVLDFASQKNEELKNSINEAQIQKEKLKAVSKAVVDEVIDGGVKDEKKVESKGE